MSVDEREAQNTERRRKLTRGQSAGLMILGGAALVGVTVWNGTDTTEPPQPREPLVSVSPPVWAPDVVPAAMQRPPPPPPPPQPPQMHPAQQPPPPPAPPAGPVGNTSRPRMASYVVKESKAAAQEAAPSSHPGSDANPHARPQRTSVAFKGENIVGGRAGAAMDTSLMLMPGIYGCILDTAVNSERPGPFQCHTDDDILSPARVPLMKAGTIIIGETQGGDNVRPGQARIPSLVATAWTPEGIPVPLGAAVSDSLGRTGMPGQVNRHLAERFGGAVMLLTSQAAIDLARASLMQGQGNSQVNVNTGGVQGVASDVLRSTIAIPNTIEKNQGEAIAFFVTKPISFEDAIRLSPR